MAMLLDVLRELSEVDPPLHVFGGVAEDAVLHGRLTRPHSDIDVFVLRSELPTCLAQLAPLGFDDFETLVEERAGAPLVLAAQRGGVSVELGVFDQTAGGEFYFELDGEGGRYQVYLPADALTAPPVEVDGVTISALSALALYQIREGLYQIGSFGPPRDKDLVAQALLAERLGDQAQAAVVSRVDS